MSSLHPMPWQNKGEWKTLYEELWSGDIVQNCLALKKVLSLLIESSIDIQIYNWSLIGTLPFELEITALLLEADKRTKDSELDSIAIEALYSSAIIRLVAAVKDNSTILEIKPDVELPFSVLQYRNDFVHSQRPSYETARRVASIALQFLKANYWDFLLETSMSNKRLKELLEKYFNLYKQDEESNEDPNFSKKVTKLLKTIERMTDRSSLFPCLLNDLDLLQATEESFPFYAKGLENMAKVFGSTWSLQLADFCLQEWINVANDSAHFHWLIRLKDWTALLISCPVESTRVESIIIDDLFQKFFYLIQKMKIIQRSTSQLQSIMESSMDTLNKLLDWLSGLTNLEITKTKLRIIFEEIINSPSLKEQNLDLLKITDLNIGVFSLVKNWTPCRIGTLPFNYITD